ncbi:hypothetical protein DFH07DRAFT_946007 [Mycena maculata]|uniref:Uncharacterized protein n=1 Tax=Mycena maculata TaxID=230809 RepID=A0AAD7HRM8_9AGAR|nr:hypothetical protein DFH07DRAFT_946007 [Mycena maculata]
MILAPVPAAAVSSAAKTRTFRPSTTIAALAPAICIVSCRPLPLRRPSLKMPPRLFALHYLLWAHHASINPHSHWVRGDEHYAPPAFTYYSLRFLYCRILVFTGRRGTMYYKCN